MSDFDPELLLNHAPVEGKTELTAEAAMLYALGVGATELPFVYEAGVRVLPTMVEVMGYPGFILADPAYRIDLKQLLHGETGFTLHAALPTEGEVTGRTTFGPIFDKGPDKGAVLCQTRTLHRADGELFATVRNAAFLRGDGGRGGSPGRQPAPAAVPERTPDLVRPLATASNQALIYRLSGDLNPLHVDPAVARAAGFERPILHGLCTFAVAGRALLAALCDNDPSRVRSMDVRFSSPVYPGETIETEIWRTGEGRAAFRARVVERGAIVLNNGLLEYA